MDQHHHPSGEEQNICLKYDLSEASSSPPGSVSGASSQESGHCLCTGIDDARSIDRSSLPNSIDKIV